MAGQILDQISALGVKIEATRVLTGHGTAPSIIITSAFEKSSAQLLSENPGDKTASTAAATTSPNLVAQLQQKVHEYAEHVLFNDPPALATPIDHISKVLSDIELVWTTPATIAEAVSSQTEKRHMSQLEYNHMVADELKKNKSDMGELKLEEVLEGFKALRSNSAVEEARAVEEEQFLAGKSRPASIPLRVESAQRALSIGDARYSAGNASGAASAFRYGLWQLNFENKHDIVWYNAMAEREHRQKKNDIETAVNPTLATLHFKLAQSLLKLSADTIQSFADRTILATEAASQASAACALDGENVEAIFVRGQSRMSAEDFSGASSDLKECIRRFPNDKRFRQGLVEMNENRKSALEREKKLWGRKGFLLEQEDFSFMGEEDNWSVKTAKSFAMRNPVPVIILVVFFIFALHHFLDLDSAKYVQDSKAYRQFLKKVMRELTGVQEEEVELEAAHEVTRVDAEEEFIDLDAQECVRASGSC
jgi:hypothetical protein